MIEHVNDLEFVDPRDMYFAQLTQVVGSLARTTSLSGNEKPEPVAIHPHHLRELPVEMFLLIKPKTI
jgi:hypothetical protein